MQRKSFLVLFCTIVVLFVELNSGAPTEQATTKATTTKKTTTKKPTTTKIQKTSPETK
jgi:hypothetical protein